MELQIVDQQALQRPLAQLGLDGAGLTGESLQHSGNLPGAVNNLALGHQLVDPAPVQGLLGSPLAAGIHQIVGALRTQEVLHQHKHAVTGHQAEEQVVVIELGVLGGQGDIAQQGGIPVETGTGNGADGGDVDVEDHVLDQVGVVDVLMVKALFGVGAPAVRILVHHPVVALVSPNQNFVLAIQGDNAAELTHGAMIGAAPAHGVVIGLHGDLKNAVLPVQIKVILEPLPVFFQFGELDVISHNVFHCLFPPVRFCLCSKLYAFAAFTAW